MNGMWVPVTVIAALFSWAVCYGFFVLVADLSVRLIAAVNIASAVFSP